MGVRSSSRTAKEPEMPRFESVSIVDLIAGAKAPGPLALTKKTTKTL
jgi:hypothetical protein